MGLLANAIRDHLELKRRHGADPQEVAHLEQEALGPAEYVEEYDQLSYGPDQLSSYAERQAESEAAQEGDPLDAYAASIAQHPDSASSDARVSRHVSSETMEIDMLEVIGVGQAAPPHAAPPFAAHRSGDAVGVRSHREPDIVDRGVDLDWETPHRARRAS